MTRPDAARWWLCSAIQIHHHRRRRLRVSLSAPRRQSSAYRPLFLSHLNRLRISSDRLHSAPSIKFTGPGFNPPHALILCPPGRSVPNLDNASSTTAAPSYARIYRRYTLLCIDASAGYALTRFSTGPPPPPPPPPGGLPSRPPAAAAQGRVRTTCTYLKLAGC
jgi:hypothetical protein